MFLSTIIHISSYFVYLCCTYLYFVVKTRAAESEVPSSDSDSWQFRLSDSDSGPTPTFSSISYLK